MEEFSAYDSQEDSNPGLQVIIRDILSTSYLFFEPSYVGAKFGIRKKENQSSNNLDTLLCLIDDGSIFGIEAKRA